jgi:type II secretory pathway pseudopilin PulG
VRKLRQTSGDHVLRDRWSRPGRSARTRRAFTVVELMVVIGVIALILVIGIPAFNTMAVQQRYSKTRQLLNGTLTRTHVIALSDRTLAAVRLCPAEWAQAGGEEKAEAAGRQIAMTYTYRATYAADPDNPQQVHFDERFERLEDGPTQLLPPGIWVAPSEALLDQDADDWFDGDEVLRGEIGTFAFDAIESEDLLPADDFLIVFDPETGVVRQNSNWPWKVWRLLAYDPVTETETAGDDWSAGGYDQPFQRFNFTGVVVYQREPFAQLGASAEPDDRRSVLRRTGQTYYVNRMGGSLVAGARETQGGE